MELRAVLLAASIAPAEAEALWSEGIEVRKPKRRWMAGLCEAALEIRKEHPRLPLVVSASERTLRRFERQHPPLIDVAVLSATAEAVLAALAA